MEIEEFIEDYIKEGGDKSNLGNILQGMYPEEKIKESLKKRNLHYDDPNKDAKRVAFISKNLEKGAGILVGIILAIFFTFYPINFFVISILIIFLLPKIAIVTLIIRKIAIIYQKDSSLTKSVVWGTSLTLIGVPGIYINSMVLTSLATLMVVYGLTLSYNFKFKEGLTTFICLAIVDILYGLIMLFLMAFLLRL